MTINFGATFEAFCIKNKLGKWTKDSKKDIWIEFNMDEFHFFNDKKLIFDGTNGGLIIGPLHVHGGIHMLKPNKDITKFTYVGEMEGWEYLTYPLKSSEISIEFEKINSLNSNGVTDRKTEFEPPIGCNVVNTFNTEIPILLISPFTQFVINRFSTAEHINQILEIESKNKR